MSRGLEHGHYCQAAWQSLWLHSAVKLLGGRVHIGGRDSNRVSVSISNPRGNFNCRSSRMVGGSLHLQPVQKCSYRSTLYLWSAKLLLRISEARFCAYCRCRRHCGWLLWCQGSVGTTMFRRFTARCSSKHGQSCAFSKWLALRGSVVPWAVCDRWTDRRAPCNSSSSSVFNVLDSSCSPPG